jgi:hypothetical protein
MLIHFFIERSDFVNAEIGSSIVKRPAGLAFMSASLVAFTISWGLLLVLWI